MTALAHVLPALATRAEDPTRDLPAVAARLWLRATERGWSLVARDGAVVFGGVGLASRSECLRRAYDLGVLAVLS